MNEGFSIAGAHILTKTTRILTVVAFACRCSSGAPWCENCMHYPVNSAIMKKSTSRPKTADSPPARDLQKDARPERFNRARPARDNNSEPLSRAAGNSTIHNGSADAFDATEEARDDEDSDEDNDDFAREHD
jgi:hypothetical protein